MQWVWLRAGSSYTAVLWNFNAAGGLQRCLGFVSEVKRGSFPHVQSNWDTYKKQEGFVWPFRLNRHDMTAWQLAPYQYLWLSKKTKVIRNPLSNSNLWLWYYSSPFRLLSACHLAVVVMVMWGIPSPSLHGLCLTFMGLKSSEWWSASVWDSKLHRFNWEESSPWVCGGPYGLALNRTACCTSI